MTFYLFRIVFETVYTVLAAQGVKHLNFKQLVTVVLIKTRSSATVDVNHLVKVHLNERTYSGHDCALLQAVRLHLLI